MAKSDPNVRSPVAPIKNAPDSRTMKRAISLHSSGKYDAGCELYVCLHYRRIVPIHAKLAMTRRLRVVDSYDLRFAMKLLQNGPSF